MKKIIILIILIASLTTFSFNLSSNNIIISKELLNLSDSASGGIYIGFNLDNILDNLSFGINYNDEEEFFTYQKVFFKKVKLKAGERNFGFSIGYYNNSIILSTEVKKYKNDLISKSFSYSYISVYKGGSEERKLSLDKYLIPTIAKASVFTSSFNDVINNNSVLNVGVQLQRYITIPFIISKSDLGYSLSIPIGIIEDKYISGFFSYGILNDGSPIFNFQTPFNKDYYAGIQLKMNNNPNFIIYLSKLNIDNPFTIMITKNGGSFFFEY
ncbi:hypothetical protein [Marinitoga sp. 38H-ov]|uniref:hypothetical protein n=1 Tax=Marinitoga sp. 38H-ov TaxID=1755814 RepID=UPI0013EC0ED8|nr:hypothetical protein [Marinitoga sp. 38H-ov]KAF2955570.1 hypothetical protein AS160_09365 [Marinitoga sp. 38H-ov]